jgi:hypothetical protein
MMTRSFAEMELNTSFDQRMTVLAPEISDLDAKRLRARWVQMKTRSDYLGINGTLESMASAHGVSLPKPLWN